MTTRIMRWLQRVAPPRERIAVYTVVTGNYEPLKIPLVVNPHFDYIAYVDDPNFPVPPPWQRRMTTVTQPSHRLTSRFYKLHPHLLFPNYQKSVYLDASLQIQSDFLVLIDAALREHDLAQFVHPERNCIYQEAQTVVNWRLDSPEVVEPQISRYRQEGYPENNGLFASGFIIRRHHHPLVIKSMQEWWQEIQRHSHRDQLSGMVVFWRNRLTCYPIQGSIYSNEYVVFSRKKPGVPTA